MSKRRRSPLAKHRKSLVSSKAEPIAEDDFDLEVKEDANRYNNVQRSVAQRSAVVQENKKRKRDGIQPLQLPKVIKNADHSSKIDTNDTSDSEADAPLRRDGTRPPKIRNRQQTEEELKYEGQIVLHFNPLYRLAGLPDPDDAREAKLQAKESLIDRLVQDKAPARNSYPTDHREGDDFSPLLQEREIVFFPGDAADAHGSQEQEYEDEIVVPWAPLRMEHGSPSDTGSETYSDDDRMELMRNVPTSPPMHGTSQDSMTCRPSFAFAEGTDQGSPLILDEGSTGFAVPAPINRFLKEYQRAGVRFLYKNYAVGTGGILGDDMGLGKTIQVISFLSAIMRKTGYASDTERRKRTIRRGGSNLSPQHWATALVVCPKFLLRNWQREFNTWGYFESAIWQADSWPDTRGMFMRGYYDFLLVSYETLRSTIENLKDMPFSVVIADEAHRLKEPRAAITLAMKKLRCPSCMALTGTLIQNRMDEMWSVLDFARRGQAGTLRQWREFAVNPIKKGHRHEGTAEEVVTAIRRLGIVVHKILPLFYLRRDKRLIKDELPEKRDMVVFCPLGDRQIMAYQNLIDSDDVQFILRRNEPCECSSSKSRVACHHATNSQGERIRDVVLKNINALSKVANHFGVLYQANDDSPATREVNKKLFKLCTGEDYDNKEHNIIEAALDSSNCGKWTLLAGLLKEWRDPPQARNKVLLFSSSVRLLKMIAEFISTSLSGFSFEVLTGEASADERMTMIDRFQDLDQDYYILLISTLAGGVGLNLTAANKVVIFDPAWNPANDLQAMDRAFRIGQKRMVDVYRLIGKGTLEELMYERQIHKQQRSRQLNEGTFESRIHTGYDGAKDVVDQGELFGTHNIFRFDPNGFVSRNLERVRQAEDRFVQDLIEADFDDNETEEESEDDAVKTLRDARRKRDMSRAQQMARKRRDEESVMENVLGPGLPKSTSLMGMKLILGPSLAGDVLQRFGMHSHLHEGAFKDSEEEKKIYEIGLQLLATNPEMARKVKANDLGRLDKRILGSNRPEKAKRRETDVEGEPWKDRIKARPKQAVLAELSD